MTSAAIASNVGASASSSSVVGENAANIIADLLLEEYEYLHLPFDTDTEIELLVLYAALYDSFE